MYKICFAALTAFCLIAADDKKDDPTQKDLKLFEGTWNYASQEVNARKVPEELIKGAQLVVKGDAFTIKMPRATYEGTLKLDVTKTPKTLDFVFTAGSLKGTTVPGIYEIEGDNLKLCLAHGNKERPKEFATKESSGHALEMLKREKK